MSTYGKLPVNPFKGISFNAGTLLSDFDPTTGTLVRANIIGATTGGSQFNPNLNIISLFDGIDNAKTNTMQGQLIKDCDPHLTTTLLTATPDNITKLVPNSSAVTSGGLTTIVPTDGIIPEENFFDLWLLTDYATMDTPTGVVQGFFAIHMMNCVNVNGLQGQTSDSGKTQFSCDFRAFYDAEDESQTVPYEVYMKVPTGSIGIVTQPKSVTVEEGTATSFTVAATGTSLTYQWQLCAVGDVTFYDIEGETSTTLSLATSDVTAEASGNRYRCKVSDGNDSVYTNSAILTVEAGN